MKHWLLAGVALAPLLVCASASAAVTYEELKIDGITGGSVRTGYTGWIDVTSFSWGLTHTGATTKAAFQDFAWTQVIDTSTVPLFLDAATGKHLSKAELDVGMIGKTPGPYFEMQFTESTVTGVDIAGNGTAPTVDASFGGYQSVTLRYRPQRSDGTLGAWITGTFSVAANHVNFSGDADVLTGLLESEGAVSPGSVPITPVPEPESWALMLGGLGALGWASRRQASKRG